MSRALVCTSCGAPILVFEAAAGATTDAEHQHLDAATYVGGVCGCLKPKPLDGHGSPAWLDEAVGRARTAQQTATTDGRRTAT